MGLGGHGDGLRLRLRLRVGPSPAGWSRRVVTATVTATGTGDGGAGTRKWRAFGGNSAGKGQLGPVRRGGARSRQVRQFALGFGYRPSAIGHRPSARPLHSTLPPCPKGVERFSKSGRHAMAVTHGAWSMVHGRWLMAHGSWLIDRGIWALGHHRGTECLPFSRCPTGRLPEVPVNRTG